MSKIKIKKSFIRPIIAIFILLAIGLGIFCIVINKDAIFGTVIDKASIYTKEDLDAKYNQGYKDALTNEIKLQELIEQQKEIIADKENKITEKEIEINNNKKTIEQNNNTIASLQAEIERLENEADTNNQGHAEEIADLQTQISSLQVINQNLQIDNANNLANIVELNEQITILENRVTALTLEMEENARKVAQYEAEREALNNSITYYEDFIQSLETETQAVAIFEVNGSVYNAQIVTKGTSVTVTSPEDTETDFFVGWTLNGEDVIDLSTQTITTNTKFVAKFVNEFNVNFVVDNEIFETTKVAKNGFAVLEELPTKDGYDFDGFTLNGVDIVDYTTYAITSNNITFIAKFTKLHTVRFIVNDEVVDTQKIRNGEFAQEVEVENCDSWVINGEFVDLSQYPIYADTSIVATTFAYGLYSPDYELLKSWDDLIAENYIKVTNGNAVAMSSFKNLSNGILNISNEVTSIGDFSKCNNLISINIPNTITKISDYAFKECKSLVSVKIPNSISTLGKGIFQNCTNLTSVKLPNSIDTIPDNTFYYTGLTSIELPESILTIGAYAFSNTKLTSINLPNNLTTIGNSAFAYTLITSVKIPEGVSTITGFSLCENLVLVDLPHSATTISNYAFTGCINLTKIIIHEGLLDIGQEAFYNCGFESFKIPNTVTHLGKGVFRYCQKLNSVYIPSSVKTIEGGLNLGDNIFSYCTQNLVIYCEATSIQEGWYYKFNIGKDWDTTLIVKYGYTYNQYCEEVGLNSVSTATAVDTLITFLNSSNLPTNKFSVGA